MAKALSHLHASIRGSVGGLTYSANQYAQILLKNRIAPVQPNTGSQTLVRSSLNAASMAWQALTDAQRQDWENYAQTVTYVGPQGTYQLSGRAIFIAGISLQTYSKAKGTVGQVVAPTPPTLAGKLVLGAITPGIGPNPGIGIGFSIAGNGTEDAAVIVNVSPPQNTTRLRYKGPWDDTLTQFALVPLSVVTAVKIDGLLSGRVYFVKVRGVTKTTPARVSSVEYLRLTAETLP